MESKIAISGELLLDIIEMSTRQSKQIEAYLQKLEEIMAWAANSPPPKKPNLPTAQEEIVERIRGILGLEVRCR